MPVLTIDDFSGGWDTRRTHSGSKASAMLACENFFVNTAKGLTVRPMLNHVTTLETGTRGLVAYDGGLHTFYGGTGTITHAHSLFTANNVRHPTTPATAIQHVWGAEIFAGYIYLSCSYTDDTVAHHYLDGAAPGATHIADANCPNGRGIVKAVNKIWSTGDEIVGFCAAGDPRDWTLASDAGSLAVGRQSTGSVDPVGLANFSANGSPVLVVAFVDSVQIWTIDADVTANALYSIITGVGSRFPNSLEPVNRDVFMMSEFGVRAVTANDTNILDTAVGAPIDSIFRRTSSVWDSPLTAAVYEDGRNYEATFNAGGGQYIFKTGANAYVYTFSRAHKLSAWSRWSFDSTLTEWALLDGKMYVRQGDEVFILDEEKTDADDTDAVSTATVTATLEMPFIDFGTPGTEKYIYGVDVVMGDIPQTQASTPTARSCTVQFRTNPNDLSQKYPGTAITINDDSQPGLMQPVEITTTQIAPIITMTTGGRIDKIILHYEELGAVNAPLAT